MKDILKQIKEYVKSLNKKQKAMALVVLILTAFAAALMAVLTAVEFFNL